MSAAPSLRGRAGGEAPSQLNLMLDLETASTRPDAAILSIAIVPFNLDTAEPAPEVDKYYEVVNLNSCFIEGDHFDRDTQEWWMRQDAKSKLEILSRQGGNIRMVINNAYIYLAYLAEQYELVVWSQGIDFDFPILEHAIKKYVEPKEMPYQYWNKRDVRTILKWCDVDYRNIERTGTAHNALDDCRTQIKNVQAAYAKRSV